MYYKKTHNLGNNGDQPWYYACCCALNFSTIGTLFTFTGLGFGLTVLIHLAMVGNENSTSERDIPILYTVNAILRNLGLCMFICKEKEFTFPFMRNHFVLLFPCLDTVQPPQPDLGEPESPGVFMGPPLGKASLVGGQATRGQTIPTVLDSSDSSGIYMGPGGQPLPAASQVDRQVPIGQTGINILDAHDSSGIHMGPASQPLTVASQYDRHANTGSQTIHTVQIIPDSSGSIWGQWVNPCQYL